MIGELINFLFAMTKYSYTKNKTNIVMHTLVYHTQSEDTKQ